MEKRRKQVEQDRLKAKGRTAAQVCMQEVILAWRKQESLGLGEKF